MGTVWLVHALLTVLLASRVCWALSERICDDTIGREFYIGVLPSFYKGMSISLVASTKSTGLVTVLASSVGLNSTFSLTNNTRTLSVNRSIMQKQNATIQDKTIIVYSTVDISLVLNTFPGGAYEEVLILPRKCLSTRYIVSSYYPNTRFPNLHSNFLVVGTQDNTSIHVTVRIGNSSISNFTFYLDNKQSYLYNNVQDLTGTIILSDKPIAVFSGHEAIVFTSGDYVSEQLIPSSRFGTSFIVPTLYPKSRYFIRIIASESDTHVEYRQGTATITRRLTLNRSGDFIEIVVTKPLFIDAQKPVSVMLYSFDYSDNGDSIGAPFLSTVPAFSQYISEYIFTIPDELIAFVNYISIMASNDNILADIKLDGNHLPATASSFNLTVNGSVYFVNTYTVPTGFHRLVHSKQIPFGAILYGYQTEYSYGTALGLNFDKSRLDHSPTPGLPDRDKRGPMCYDCLHVSNMTECHTVRLCYKDEVCGIEKFTWGGLYEHFTAGCHRKQCTHSTRSVPDCQHCCQDDFCNTECSQTNTVPVFIG